MLLKSIDDPRSNLDRARRRELLDYAKSNGVDLDENMPAIIMRDILRKSGHTRVAVPNRSLGAMNQNRTGGYQNKMSNAPRKEQGIEADAVSDLMRQYQQQKPLVQAPEKMTIGQMRATCKARGIKISPSDNKITLRAKLDGKDAS